MKINVIKDHHHYGLGQHEVSDERGLYLISIGAAEEVKEAETKMIQPKKETKISPVVLDNKKGTKQKNK